MAKKINEEIDNENEVNEEGFTDRVDRDFDTSLYEYGVVRNPENGMTLIGTKPTDEGVYSDYVVMYISLEDVKEVLEDMEDGFFDYIDSDKETKMTELSNDNLATTIMEIDMYNGYWADQAFYMENHNSKVSKKSASLNENEKGIDLIKDAIEAEMERQGFRNMGVDVDEGAFEPSITLFTHWSDEFSAKQADLINDEFNVFKTTEYLDGAEVYTEEDVNTLKDVDGQTTSEGHVSFVALISPDTKITPAFAEEVANKYVAQMTNFWDEVYSEEMLNFEENHKKQSIKKSVNEGNYEGGDAYYQFCKDIKQIMNEGHDFEEAVYECLDDMVYYSDVINVWTNLPGNLGSRDQEITDLMREDIEEAVMDDREFIEGLDESLDKKSVNEVMSVKKAKELYKKQGLLKLDDKEDKAAYDALYNAGYTMKKNLNGDVAYVIEFGRMRESFKPAHKFRKSVNETIYNKYGEPLTDEEWNKREALGMNEMGYRSQLSGVRLNKKVGTTDKDGVVNYRGTDVFTLKDGVVKLNNGGWFTQTTKDRMNQALDQYNVGGEVKQIKGKWYYIKNGERKEFEKNGTLTLSLGESLNKANVMKNIINESQRLISMNESECGEMLTWQFTLSDRPTGKVSFGGNDVNCVLTEGNTGIAVTNFTMTEEQVEKAINEALVENNIKGKVSKLINLY